MQLIRRCFFAAQGALGHLSIHAANAANAVIYIPHHLQSLSDQTQCIFEGLFRMYLDIFESTFFLLHEKKKKTSSSTPMAFLKIYLST